MPRAHDHHTAIVPVTRHPLWCSPQYCVIDEDGVRVHEQQPVCWEDCEVRFESRLLLPDGKHPPNTYLQLSIENLVTSRFVDAFLPIAAVRRLRDQLTAHLDAADSYPTTPSPASEVNAMP